MDRVILVTRVSQNTRRGARSQYCGRENTRITSHRPRNFLVLLELLPPGSIHNPQAGPPTAGPRWAGSARRRLLRPVCCRIEQQEVLAFASPDIPAAREPPTELVTPAGIGLLAVRETGPVAAHRRRSRFQAAAWSWLLMSAQACSVQPQRADVFGAGTNRPAKEAAPWPAPGPRRSRRSTWSYGRSAARSCAG